MAVKTLYEIEVIKIYFNIDPKLSTPLYEQIILQVKEMYAKGLIKPNEQLPSVRELSSQMVINPNTVSKAYQELERQGVIVTIQGRGTFIAKEVAPLRNPQQIQSIKQSIRQLIIDSHYAGFSKQELFDWLHNVYEELEEGKNGG